MILTINTTDREKIILGIYDGKNLSCFDFETQYQSEDILSSIEGILKKKKLSTTDIEAILVHEGPGSYTGVRVGVTVANTLAWSLDIPVLPYQDESLTETLNAVKKQNNFNKLALPQYYDKL